MKRDVLLTVGALAVILIAGAAVWHFLGSPPGYTQDSAAMLPTQGTPDVDLSRDGAVGSGPRPAEASLPADGEAPSADSLRNVVDVADGNSQEPLVLTEAETWELTYANASITDLELERDHLVRYLAFKTNAEFNRMFDSGLYVVLRNDDTIRSSDMDPESLCRVQLNKDVEPPEIRRATLPEHGNEAAHATWRQINWMQKEISDRRAVAKQLADERARLHGLDPDSSEGADH